MKTVQNPIFPFRKISLTFLLIIIAASLNFAQEKSLPGKIVSLPVDSINKVKVADFGYGVQMKTEVTGSISAINYVEFNSGHIERPEQLIQGKVSGLGISKPGSDPNGKYYLRLRGLNTISAYDQPLIVIDGVIDASFDIVDPNDIESITVLKDGATAALYGTRASNGVVLVTTKKGKRGTSVVEYNVYMNVESVAKNNPMMNPSEWRTLNAAVGNLGTDFGGNTDWLKEIEQTALSQVHNLSISGGTEKTSYRASLNFRQGNGIQIETGYTQLNGRVSLSQRALNDKLTIEVNLGATERKSRYGFPEAFRYASVFNPTAPVMSNDPTYDKYDHYFNQIIFDYYNPVQILKQNLNDGTERLLNVSLKGTYQITKGLSADAFYSIQTTSGFTGTYFAKHSFYRGIDRNGLASNSTDISSNRLFETTVHWTGSIASSVNLTALGGYSYQDFVNEGFYAGGGNFLTDAFTYNNLAAAKDFADGKGNVSSYKNSNTLIAFFGRISLNINNMWFITASARYDGSSRFGANNKWGLFPAIGAGVDLTKILNVSFIDNLKFRVDYGITGNQPWKSYMSLWQFEPGMYVYYNGNYLPGYQPVSNSNPDIKWEKKNEFDIGFDFTLLKSRLSGSFDFYANTSDDLLYQYFIPSPPNLYYYAWLNMAKVKSSGMEMTLNYNLINKEDISYSIALTPSLNFENSFVSFSGTSNGANVDPGWSYVGDLGSPGQGGAPLALAKAGEPIGQLVGFVYNGIDPSGKLMLADLNHDSQIGYLDRTIIGNGLPKFLIGFGNSIKYKNWDLNLFFRGVFGHDLLNTYRTHYELPEYIEYYNLPKTAADMKNESTGVYLKNSGGILSSKDVEKASFLSLDNLSLGYSFRLPETSAFSRIRVYLAANNLFCITRYKGSDPEPRYFDNDPYLGNYHSPIIAGVDRRNTWPRTRSFTFGANVVFQP